MFEVQLKNLLPEKKYRTLVNFLEKGFLGSQNQNDSSELQVRYNSRVPDESEEFLEKFEIYFSLNRKLWKKISSKQRRLLYQLFILKGISQTERQFLEKLLAGSLGDKELRGTLEREFTRDFLIEELKEIKDNDLRYLSRMIGDLERLLNSEKIKLSDFLKIEVYSKIKPKSKRLQRHKGYRDHGSLGTDSVGLTEKQLSKIIPEGWIPLSEVIEELPEEIKQWLQDPLPFSNPWEIHGELP